MTNPNTIVTCYLTVRTSIYCTVCTVLYCTYSTVLYELIVLYCGIEWCCQYDMAQFYHTICMVGTLSYCQQHSMSFMQTVRSHLFYNMWFDTCTEHCTIVKDMKPVTYIRISKFHHRISMVTEILVDFTGIIPYSTCSIAPLLLYNMMWFDTQGTRGEVTHVR